MNKYYHYTNYNSMRSIANEGLVPKIGLRSMTKSDNRCAVFLSNGITNSIKMYAEMLRNYNEHSGHKGLQEINHLKTILNKLDEKINIEIINEIKQGIYIIEYIFNCKNFVDYLGGEGYLLSINELDNVVSKTPEDCYYNDIIPTNNINVLILKNEEKGHIIDSREILMNYFLRNIPYNTLLNIIQDEKTLCDLYNLLNEYNYIDYTGYKLQEVLLDYYNYEKKKIRPLIFI